LQENSTVNKDDRHAPSNSIDVIISQLPGLKDDLIQKNINLAEEKSICIFGYGSLSRKPHHKPTSKIPALLQGYKKDFNCQSVSAGTPKFPGLTLGLSQDKNSYVSGTNLCYTGLSQSERSQMLHNFAQREALSSKIYKFKMIETLQYDGQRVFSLTCVANTDTDHFIGDALSNDERLGLSEKAQMELSILKKAAIIAQAQGPRGTNKSYLDRFIAYDLTKDQNIETLHNHLTKKIDTGDVINALYESENYMKKLILAVNEFRDSMTKNKRQKLEQIEENQWSNFVRQQKKSPLFLFSPHNL